MVLKHFRARFSGPKPAGAPESIRAFRTSDPTITRNGITTEDDEWIIDSTDGVSVRMFEVADPNAEKCVLQYRAKIKTERLEGRAFLEMWCRLPGRGEFFSKGFDQAAKGTTDWAAHEVPFHLKAGERPDLVKLNLTIEGRGSVRIKDIELVRTPIK